jgi:hypothetical protein
MHSRGLAVVGPAVYASSTFAPSRYVSAAQLGNISLNDDDWAAKYEELLDKAGGLLTKPLFAPNLPTPICLLCAEKDPVPPENSVRVAAQGLTHFASCCPIGYDSASQNRN